MWREKSRLERNWERIVEYRAHCDAIIKNCPQVNFAVSALTGLFNKGAKGLTPKEIYPAISYWVASQDAKAFRKILDSGIHEAYPIAQIKDVSPKSSSLDKEEHLAAPLFVCVKDYNSAYVQNRLRSSREACGISSPHQITKLIVPNKLYQDIAQIVCLELAKVSMIVDVEMV